jgi:hypothetical protein
MLRRRWATQGKRGLVLAQLAIVVGAVTTLAAFEGCGSSSGNNAGPADASGASDSATTPLDAPGEAVAAEAGPDCGAVPPSGTQLVPSTDPLVVLTLTADHAIYEDLSTQEIYGVALDGGAPSDIGKMKSQSSTVFAHGSTLLYLPVETDPMTAIGPLSSWTPTGGTSVISTTILAEDAYDYTYDASKDGQWVAYYETSNGQAATLTVSTVDGKTQTPLVTAIDLVDINKAMNAYLCNPPVLQFVNDTLVGQFCKKEVSDAGVSADVELVMAFTAPSFAPVVLQTLPVPQGYLGPIPFDPTGTSALMLGPTGVGLSLYPLAGGTPVPIDPKGTAGLFASNGDVLYTTTDTALIRYVAATATTTTLVPTGLTLPLDLSPDGNWLQVAAGESSAGLTNLYLASATTPGAVNTVVKSETAGAIGFSPNSAYSLFGTGFSEMFGPSTYALQSSPSDGGAAVKVLDVTDGTGVYASTGSKLVVPTNVNKATGATDLVSVDLSSTAAPTPLVTQVDPNVFQTSTKAIVYSWYCNENGTSGIWALTPP